MVSVGPYRFVTTPTPATSRSAANVGASTSPPTSSCVRRPRARRSSSSASSTRARDGVSCAWVTPWRATSVPRLARWVAGPARPGASTTVQPSVSAHTSSTTDGSNDSDVDASSTGTGASEGRTAAPMASRKWARFPWSICTPFGRPVDPEV